MNKKLMKEYRIWKSMKSRCNSKCNKDTHYQKDGIKVCDRWKNSFENFLKDMGNIPSENHSIERKNIYEDYCPQNCVWVLMSEQSKNRRTIKLFNYNGETKILKDWASHFNIKYTTLYNRIYRNGLSFEEAIKEDPYNRNIEINGEKMILKYWCIKLNLKYQTILNRIHDGMTVEKALFFKKTV